MNEPSELWLEVRVFVFGVVVAIIRHGWVEGWVWEWKGEGKVEGDTPLINERVERVQTGRGGGRREDGEWWYGRERLRPACAAHVWRDIRGRRKCTRLGHHRLEWLEGRWWLLRLLRDQWIQGASCCFSWSARSNDRICGTHRFLLKLVPRSDQTKQRNRADFNLVSALVSTLPFGINTTQLIRSRHSDKSIRCLGTVPVNFVSKLDRLARMEVSRAKKYLCQLDLDLSSLLMNTYREHGKLVSKFWILRRGVCTIHPTKSMWLLHDKWLTKVRHAISRYGPGWWASLVWLHQPSADSIHFFTRLIGAFGAGRLPFSCDGYGILYSFFG